MLHIAPGIETSVTEAIILTRSWATLLPRNNYISRYISRVSMHTGTRSTPGYGPACYPARNLWRKNKKPDSVWWTGQFGKMHKKTHQHRSHQPISGCFSLKERQHRKHTSTWHFGLNNKKNLFMLPYLKPKRQKSNSGPNTNLKNSLTVSRKAY